jgi:two-component system sensor histidine kinase/response regulator
MATSAPQGAWRASQRMHVSTGMPLDIAEMRRRLGDDEALIADVVILFLEDYASRLDALQTAVDAGDAARIRRIAHAIGGSAANLAAISVVDAAGELEAMSGAGDAQGIAIGFEALVAEVKRLAAALSGLDPGGVEDLSQVRR